MDDIGLPSILGNLHIHIYPQKETDYTYIRGKKETMPYHLEISTPTLSRRLKLIDLHAMIHRRVPQGFPRSCGALRVLWKNEGDAWQTKRSCGNILMKLRPNQQILWTSLWNRLIIPFTSGEPPWRSDRPWSQDCPHVLPRLHRWPARPGKIWLSGRIAVEIMLALEMAIPIRAMF
jgi:hypothetical protein